MLTRIISSLLMLLLISSFCETSAFSSGPSEKIPQPIVDQVISVNTEARPDAKLRAEMEKLVADARAGKVIAAARPQIQPAKSNSLSKKAKVAIGVGIAVIVLAVIIKHEKDNFFNCKSRCVI